MSPSLEFYSHVDGLAEPDLDKLEQRARLAVPICLANPGPASRDLSSLATVEISIVSDETIAAIHGQFLNDPSATDVITFQHGEVLVSYDTASREATSHGHSTLEELILYVVHGLLHLNGHLDKEAPDRREMHRIQNEIWTAILEEPR